MIRFSSPSLPLVFSDDNCSRSSSSSSTVQESRVHQHVIRQSLSPSDIHAQGQFERACRETLKILSRGGPLVASKLNTICIFHRWTESILFQEQHEEDEPQQLQQSQETPFNPSEFFSEINRFKSRLHSLERERYELEEKVRRFQVCSICLHRHRCRNAAFFLLLLQTQNSGYSNYADNDWIGFRSISSVSGRTTPSTVVGKKCLVTQRCLRLYMEGHE